LKKLPFDSVWFFFALHLCLAACSHGGSTDRHSVGVTVTGLEGELVIRNNGRDLLTLTENGNFIFAERINNSEPAHIEILQMPRQPNQTCTISPAEFRVTRDMNIPINCVTDEYSINGTVSGLVGSGLVLQNTDSDPVDVLAMDVNGAFKFTEPVADHQDYNIEVLVQPTKPSQTCALNSAGSGTMAGADIEDVTVTCTTDTFVVGVRVDNLLGEGLQLRDLQGDSIDVTDLRARFLEISKTQ